MLTGTKANLGITLTKRNKNQDFTPLYINHIGYEYKVTSPV